MSQETWNTDVDPQRDAEIKLQYGIDPANHASNPRTVERFTRDILDQFPSIRSQRQPLTERFKRWEALWQSKHTVRLYEGRSDIFVPRAMKVIEGHAARLVGNIFPNKPRYEITPMDDLGEDFAKPAQMILDHFLDESRLESRSHSFVREGLKHGTSIFKSWWHNRKTMNYRRRPVAEKGQIVTGGQPKTYLKGEEVIQFEGPRAKVVDLLRWYIHPITAENIDEYQIIFEDMDLSVAHVTASQKSKANPHGYVNVDRLLAMKKKANADGNTDTNSDRDDRLAAMGFSVQNQVKDARLQVTEVWCKFDLYGRGESIDCLAYVGAFGDGAPILLSLKQNPFANQRPPYRAWRVRDSVDNFYGQGLLESLESLQYALNAFFNQALDSANFTINQMMVVDVMKLAMRAKDIRLAPLSVLPVRGDVRQAFAAWAPNDVSQTAIQLSVLLGGLMEDAGFAGADSRSGRSVESATEAAGFIQAASQFDETAVKKIEADVMTDLLRDWYRMGEQFLSPETYSRITQIPKEQDPVQALVGDYNLKWSVHNMAQEREALELQMLQATLQKTLVETQISQMTGQMGGSTAANKGSGNGPQGPTGGSGTPQIPTG